jgi:aspartate racemase
MPPIRNLSGTKRALLEKRLGGGTTLVSTPGGVITRRERRGPIPLSFAQQQFWLLNELSPDSALYHHEIGLRMPQTLDVTALEQSLSEIIRRHEAWRTSFPLVDGQPVQLIHPPEGFRLACTDLSHLAASPQETEMQRLQQRLGRPFDLKEAPPLRAHLVCLGDAGYRLFLNLHHILYDGVALWDLFVPELVTLYQAFSAGRPSPLPEPSLQYADYALWQRETLDAAALAAHLAYWTTQLAEAPTELHLPTDHARPLASAPRGAYARFALPAPLRESLTALSLAEGATLFMTELAAFATLLLRYTGQEDLVIGTPATLRKFPELEGLLGVCINTLALRVNLRGDPSFRALLRRVRQTVLSALDHADLPFEELVKTLHPERAWGQNPLFQTILTHEQALPPLPTGWAFDAVATQSEIAVDLRVILEERPEGLGGIVEYHPDLFEATTIERLIGNFQTLLGGICRDPDQPLSALPVLSEAERHQVLVEWNATQTAYPKDQPVNRLFEAQVEQTPGAIALLYEGTDITYHALNCCANQLAHFLQKEGVGPEVCVGVCLDRTPLLVIALLGILKAGGAYVPLDPTYPKERLTFMLEDSNARVLLTERSCLTAMPPPGITTISLDTAWQTLAGEPHVNVRGKATAQNLAYVMFTSGSTGKPKGVKIQHDNIVRLVCGVDYAVLDATKTLLHLAPSAFDASTFEVWGALLNGARCVLLPDRLPTPKRIGALIREQQVTTLWLTASLFNLFIDIAPEALTPVEQVLTGGEALSVARIRRALEVLPATQLINGYGPTESTTFACCYPIPRSLDEGLRSIPIGRPIANTRMYILDPHLNPVPIGVPGELHIAGDGLARGYLHRPELTAERFIPDPFSRRPDARLYKTGDLARWLPDGTIEFLGRLDDQVKIRGFRIEPGEVEAVLGQHPAVREAVVLVIERADGDKRLVAYLVPKQQGETSVPVTLHDFLRERLPEYMIPAAFVWLDRFPLTPVGKLDRRSLPAPVWSECSSEFVAPGTKTERWLAAIWCDLLQVDQVGATDNFFKLGGYSLLATRLFARLSSELNTTLPIRWIFDHPTIAGLAAAIEQAFPAALLHAQAQAGQEDKYLGPTPAGGGTPPFPLSPEAVSVETRPLLSLITSGGLPPVEAVALGYLPDDFFPHQQREAVRRQLFQGLPVLTNLLDTSLGRIGAITLPLTAQELYQDQAHLVGLCRQARTMAKAIGARAMALTGLLPSATAYGQAILEGEAPDPVQITTGHATTTAAVVSTIAHILREAGRELSQERVAFVGLGSVGTAVLRLMLAALPHPRELLLCDLYTKAATLETLRREVTGSLRFSGQVQLLESNGLTLPDRFYTASMMIGATNVPAVLDIARVRSGALAVDDSGPHCFDAAHAIKRFEEQGDILFTEGGALLSPIPIQELVYAPEEWIQAVGEVAPLLVSWHQEHIMGCVLSGLLAAREEDLPPTIGPVSTEDSRLHLARLEALGFGAAPLHCEGYRLPDERIAAFRRRYGRGYA